ncbi:MAG: ABC transporter permease [Desulfobacteraceae bacterium]|nr:ABC transporter permease [Desulfobacteraceae bacterium]
MIRSFVQKLGMRTISGGRFCFTLIELVWDILSGFYKLTNKAVFAEMIRQIHFIAVQTLPLILICALAMGSIVVHFLLNLLTSLGAYDEIGKYLASTMLNEIAPIATSIIILVRVVPAITAQLSIMKITNETTTFKMLDIDIRKYVYLPRVFAFGFAGFSLSIIFAATALVGGFVITGHRHDITWENYIDRIIYAPGLKEVLILFCKPFLMSVGIAFSSLVNCMHAENSFAKVPEILTRGMMISIIVIIFMEGLFFFIVR